MPAAPAPSNPDTLLHGKGKLRLDWTLRGLLPAWCRSTLPRPDVLGARLPQGEPRLM